MACNHARAVEYFIETISSRMSTLSFNCESFEKYEVGGCMNQWRSKLGYDWLEQNEMHHSNFLITRSQDPYVGRSVLLDPQHAHLAVKPDIGHVCQVCLDQEYNPGKHFRSTVHDKADIF